MNEKKKTPCYRVTYLVSVGALMLQGQLDFTTRKSRFEIDFEALVMSHVIVKSKSYAIFDSILDVVEVI